MRDKNVDRKKVFELVLAIFMSQVFDPDAITIGTEREHVVFDPGRPHELRGALEIVQCLGRRTGWIVDRDGDSELIVKAVAPGGEYTIMTDAGQGIIEIVTNQPTASLEKLEEVVRRAENDAISAAKEFGLKIIGVGRHPLGKALNKSAWVPKMRYVDGLVLVLRGGGHETCETASQQDTTDATSQEHQLLMINAGNALSGAIAALGANSGVFHGEIHRNQLASRVKTWSRICYPNQQMRVGVPDRPFGSVEDYVNRLIDLPYLFHLRKDGRPEVFNQPFWQAVSNFHEVGLEYLLAVHMACDWLNVRARINKRACVEWRVPGAQPQGQGRMLSALHLGLALNPEGLRELYESHTWEEWQKSFDDGANLGLRCNVGDETMTAVVERLLNVATAGLSRTHQVREIYPLYPRVLCPEQNLPALQAIDAFESGIERLVELREFVPNEVAAQAVA